MTDSLNRSLLVITKSSLDAGDVFERLEDEGAQIMYYPTIEIRPVSNMEVIDRAVASVDDYEWFIFTSRNAVELFMERLEDINVDLNEQKVKTAAVGERTAERLEDYGVTPDLVPEDFSAEGLVKAMKKKKLKGKRVLIPTSALAKDYLKDELEKAGADVDRITIYRPVMPESDDFVETTGILRNSRPDLIAFTSPSSLDNYLTALEIDDIDLYFTDITIAAIGTTTAQALRKKGIEVDIIPDEFTLEGLTDKILEYYSE